MKSKKMTYAEFKKVLKGFNEAHLTNVYTDGDGNPDFESILNSLSIHEKTQAMEESRHGLNTIARISMDRHLYLFETLDARGYYNDILK